MDFYIWAASPSFGSGTAPNLGSATCSRRVAYCLFATQGSAWPCDQYFLQSVLSRSMSRSMR